MPVFILVVFARGGFAGDHGWDSLRFFCSSWDFGGPRILEAIPGGAKFWSGFWSEFSFFC